MPREYFNNGLGFQFPISVALASAKALAAVALASVALASAALSASSHASAALTAAAHAFAALAAAAHASAALAALASAFAALAASSHASAALASASVAFIIFSIIFSSLLCTLRTMRFAQQVQNPVIYPWSLPLLSPADIGDIGPQIPHREASLKFCLAVPNIYSSGKYVFSFLPHFFVLFALAATLAAASHASAALAQASLASSALAAAASALAAASLASALAASALASAAHASASLASAASAKVFIIFSIIFSSLSGPIRFYYRTYRRPALFNVF